MSVHIVVNALPRFPWFQPHNVGSRVCVARWRKKGSNPLPSTEGMSTARLGDRPERDAVVEERFFKRFS